MPGCRCIYFHAVNNLQDAHEQIGTAVSTVLKASHLFLIFLGSSERGLIGHSSSIQPNLMLEVREIQGRPAKTTSHAFDNENHSNLD